MDRDKIVAELKSIFTLINEDLAQRRDITDDTRIQEELGLDSLQIAEILFEIEERFGVKIAEQEAREIRTVGDLIRRIQAQLGSGAA